MNKITLVLLSYVFALTLSAQNAIDSTKVKTNPIIYSSVLLGGSGSNEIQGITFSFDINYQFNKNLFTLRSLFIAERNKDVNLFSAILVVPIFIGGDSMNENSLLFGQRFIFNGSALSISAGISSNLIHYSHIDENNMKIAFEDYYVGVPFEITFNVFKGEKARYRILYGLIPIGRPTSFGRHFGIKLYGNLGRFNYFGAGITLGLGWHKKY